MWNCDRCSLCPSKGLLRDYYRTSRNLRQPSFQALVLRLLWCVYVLTPHLASGDEVAPATAILPQLPQVADISCSDSSLIRINLVFKQFSIYTQTTNINCYGSWHSEIWKSENMPGFSSLCFIYHKLSNNNLFNWTELHSSDVLYSHNIHLCTRETMIDDGHN